MASFLRRQDDLQNLKVRDLYIQDTNGAYPPVGSVLTVDDNRGHIVASGDISANSLSVCALSAANGKFNVSCPTGWVDMYPAPPTDAGYGADRASGIQLHGGVATQDKTSMGMLRTYIQSQGPVGIPGAGVTAFATTGNFGVTDPNGNFSAPMLLFDGSANKTHFIQYFGQYIDASGITVTGNFAAATIDNNYQLEPHPINVSRFMGRISTQQLQVAGFMGVNIYNNANGFQPLQPAGITSEFGGACLRNNPTSDAYPYNPAANTNRFPTIVTAWKPTAGTTTSLNYNILTMDVSNGFIGIRNNTPAYTVDVSGNLNVKGNFTASGTKAFSINHPIDATKRLVFSCIEGPRNDLIYRGRAALTAGTATVSLDADSTANGVGMTPGTFSALARNPQVYLQNNETFDRVRGTVVDNTLTIQSEATTATATIDWMVVAERKDAMMYQSAYNTADGYLLNEHPAAL